MCIRDRFRDALLKSGALCGLPKAINALTHLKEVTPSVLIDSSTIEPIAASPKLFSQNVQRPRKGSDIESFNNGIKHWNKVYDKVSTRVANNLNSAYPDLWYFTLEHIYGPLLSYDEILSATETSLIVIASLVPQSVNPQLRGHLKGALNVGCDKASVEQVRNISILCSEWCGIKWREEVCKL